jgi:hypothetical protein
MSERENLNEYEKLRYDKIKRNEQTLKDLGLGKSLLQQKQKEQKQKKSATKRKFAVPSEPTRRSSRQRKSLNYNQNDGAVEAAESESNETDESAPPSDNEESSDEGEYEEEGIDLDVVEEDDVPVKPVKRERKVSKVEPSQAEVEVDQTQVDSSGGLTLEKAKSDRSTCKKCKNKIDKGSPRVGMKAWIVGRQAMTWQCCECFLNNLTCGYETTGRTRCKATDAAFVKGELKVGARSHTAKAFYKVSAIGSVLGSVVAFMLSQNNSKLPNDLLQVQNMEGHEKLSPSDRSSLQSELDNISGQQSSSETHNVSTKMTKVDDKKVKGETEGKAKKAKMEQPILGSKSGAKGKVQWKFGGHTCYGTLLPSQETKTHCFARTHKGNTKTLAKGKDYWSMLSG